MIKFNYILNDLALSSLITKCLYSENVNYSDKEELQNQIKLIQQENKQLKDLIDTILNFEFFVGECPLNFDFGFNSNLDKAQKNFCNDEYCEKYCDNNYKKCWLKYFEKLQELEKGSDSNE